MAGVPKRLTEMQQRFAQLLVTNEGRRTPTECAIEAGYEKDSAYVRMQEYKLNYLEVSFILQMVTLIFFLSHCLKIISLDLENHTD
tara:strand:- start:445 stop:702 length:258 start_codon:yes stop_codon:yes gene_type:complete